MGRIAVAGAIMAAITISGAANAEPIGRWWTGFGQGTFEYGIKNDSAGSDDIYIACSPDYGTSIRFTVGGVNPSPRSAVLVIVGADEFELFTDENGAFETKSHVASDTFHALWDAFRAGQVARVRLSTGQSTVFTLKGAGKVLGKDGCLTTFES